MAYYVSVAANNTFSQEQAMLKAIATDDSINECECCGKANLKYTVVMLDDVTGEMYHYGSVCATRHSGLSSAQIKKQIDTLHEENKRKACQEYNNSMACIACRAKMLQAHKLELTGKQFKEFCYEEQQAANAVAAEIAVKWGIDPYCVV